MSHGGGVEGLSMAYEGVLALPLPKTSETNTTI